MPMSTALSPDGKFLLVLNGGYRPPSISVMTVAPLKEIARVPVADAWLGLTFAPGGKLVYASGGSRGTVFEFSFSSEGELKLLREMQADRRAHGTRFHRRRGDVARRPSDLRGRAAPRFHRRDQSAIRPRDRALEDRPPALPDSVRAGRKIVLRFRMGRMRRFIGTTPTAENKSRASDWRRTPPTWS